MNCSSISRFLTNDVAKTSIIDLFAASAGAVSNIARVDKNTGLVNASFTSAMRWCWADRNN